MKIFREINGEKHEIELTEDELYQAYRAQEHEYDMEDVRSELECRDEDDFQDDYGITKETAMSLISDIAYAMRSKLDDEHSMDYSRGTAISEVLTEAGQKA